MGRATEPAAYYPQKPGYRVGEDAGFAFDDAMLHAAILSHTSPDRRRRPRRRSPAPAANARLAGAARLLALPAAVALAVAACSSDGGGRDPTDEEARATTTTVPAGEVLDDASLELPLRVVIVDEAAGPRSSARTVAEVEWIIDRAEDIWAPAGIGLDLLGVERLAVDAEALDALARADLVGFARGLPEETLRTMQRSLVGFYASDIGGSNGVTPVGSTAFFVVDEPTVHDERVSAHEIGHILGLQHVPPIDRLMAAGVNGMELTDDEISTARATAARVIDTFDEANAASS